MARPKGTPDKLNATVTKEICAALEMAVPMKHAAGARGLDEGTVHYWMEQGRKGIEPYAAFFKAVTRAREIAVEKLHAKALAGGKGSSQATWFLERRFRQEYGPTQRLEHTGADGAPIAISARAVREMSDDDLAAEYERITSTKKAGARGGALPSGDSPPES